MIDIPVESSAAVKRQAMLSQMEAPKISAEEREQILKMVAESEPEVYCSYFRLTKPIFTHLQDYEDIMKFLCLAHN